MLTAIAASENNLNTFVDTHFGKCNWYCLYNMENQTSIFIENPAGKYKEKAGCEAGSLLLEKGITIAVAGRFGSNVIELFRKNNVQMIIPDTQRTLAEIINQIKKV